MAIDEEAFVFPLSFAQHRLWLLDQLSPGNAAYNMACAVRLRHPVDVAVLQASVQAVVARHEVLRTSIRVVDGAPQQVVQPLAQVAVPAMDVRGWPEVEVVGLASAEAQAPFDLSQGPLLRVRVLVGDTEDVLLLTLHHIVADGWSLDVLVRELGTCYAAGVAGGPVALPPLPIQYADFAVWQRDWLQGARLETQVEYWRRQLAGLTTLSLPTDRVRPAVASFRGGRQGVRVPAAVTRGLRAVSQAESATLFMTTVAAFQALLHRYSGQGDVAVGVPIANRPRAELEGLIGFFVNTLVLRTAVEAEEPFRALVRRVRDVALAAYAHQDVPFEKLVEVLQPARDLSRNPLFQVTFQLYTGPEKTNAARSESSLRLLDFEHETTKFDLSLALWEDGEELSGYFEYSSDLFDAATVARMAGHFGMLLAGIAAEAATPVRALPLLPPAEEAALQAWNATAIEVPSGCVHEWVAARAARTPAAVAVDAPDTVLTYGALETQANQLARVLQARGVGPETLVGVCLPRSAALIVTLLAVWKAGGAYVPLDPSYPAARRQAMWEESGAAVLVTSTAAGAAWPMSAGAHIVWVDRDRGEIAQQSTGAPVSGVTPAQLAYVLYTSGSSGRPKGVEIEHAGLANLVAWHNRTYEVQPGDRAPVAAGLGFDALGWEIWPYLSAGARLHIPSDSDRSSLPSLLDWLAAKRISIAFLATPIAEALLKDPRARRLPMRYLLTGGDTLRIWPPRDLPFTVVNHYGPTESTVVATMTPLTGPSAPRQAPPIGHPIANIEVHLLDRWLNPVPIGVPGEICLAGIGLARGYHNASDATAAAFVGYPPATGSRIYRTGDLARRLPDGGIEFLGRADAQLKIHGVRIEPAEVEAALLEHPGVTQVVVVGEDDARGGRLLVAHVVGRDGVNPAPSELRRFLFDQLPAPMIPSAFVVHERMALTEHGKFDRRSLPASGEAGHRRREFVAPWSTEEEGLAAIWRELLGLEQVAADDNFFDLGGHSLLATQLAARVRDRFGVDLQLRSVFEFPTLSELARQVAQTAGTSGPVARVEPRPDVGPCPLSFAQHRLWLLDQLSPGNAAYNMACAVRLRHPVDVAVLQASVQAVVARHEVLRTSIRVVDGAPQQVVQPLAQVAVPAMDVRGWPEVEVVGLASAEAQAPFDLSQGPLLRVRVLVGDTEDVLLLTLHHIVADGWSLDVLVRELGTCYAAGVAGGPVALPPLPIQYADFAVWQRDWLQGARLETQVEYWRRQLAGLTTLSLPTDRVRPAVASFRGGRQGVRVPAAVTRGLRAVSQAESATLFMTTVAAFQALLHRYSGQGDVAVGVPIANRPRAELEGLIGFFVNTLVLRTAVEAEEPFRALVRRVRDGALAAYAHQDVPFEKLVEVLQPARDLSRNPLFQVTFQLHHASVAAHRTEEAAIVPLLLDRTTAMFDLAMDLWEDGEELSGYFEYSSDLFDAATVARMVGHFGMLLAGIAADPTTPVGALPLLTAAEAAALQAWNATAMDVPPGCVHEWVAARAARTPAAVAVDAPDTVLTYGALETQANQLARVLQARGVGPETLVGVCLPRSPALIVTLLAVWKAGGAYVPLDPSYPAARRQAMWEESGAAVLVTSTAAGAAWPMSAGAHIVWVDRDRGEIAQQSTGAPVSGVTPAQLAYVLYTSGSSGRPKGVMVEHRAVCNRIAYGQETCPLSDKDAMLQAAPSCFDASVWEIFTPLAAGARLVLTAEDGQNDPTHLVRTMIHRGVTIAGFVPTMLRLLLDEHDFAECRGLRWVLAGGEALPAEVETLFRERLPNAELHNFYGLTETTVDATSWRCRGRTGGPTVPIGYPIGNVEAHVLDPRGQPLPVGIPGELHIGGACLARGYVHRPDLTSERFVSYPRGSGESRVRVYKTGDLVRRLPDGALEFVGRLDRQLKLGGVRIDPQEIEAQLRQFDDVVDALVVAHHQRLVAYVVARPGAHVIPGEVRAGLRERLPSLLVPSAIIPIVRWPLTVNGKIDRDALPPIADPDMAAAGDGAPLTGFEEIVAGIWRDVLGIPAVGRHENFFDVGGHSLALLQVRSRLCAMLASQIPVVEMFRYPTIGAFAAWLGSQDVATPAIGVVVERAERQRAFFDERARSAAGGARHA